MATYRIEVLGPFRVTGPDGEQCTVPGGKGTALLAYLAVDPEGADRDALAALFWPESSPPASRHSLRQALSSLRKAMGGDPFIRGERIALDPNLVETDWCDFQDCLGSDRTDACLNLVGGAPFTDVDSGVTHNFEMWVDRKRAALMERYAALLEDAGRQAIDQGKHARVHQLVELGTRAGLDGPTLRAVIQGAGGTLPAWSTAAVGPDALRAMAFRVRPEVPPSLSLVLEDHRGWTQEVLASALDSLSKAQQPTCIHLDVEDGGAGSLLPSLIRRLCEAPGGAAVSRQTLEVLERLDEDPSVFLGNGGSTDVEWALQDTLDAVLHEGPVIITILAHQLKLGDATVLAKALGIQGGEGALLVVSGTSAGELSALPLQGLSTACQHTRRIRQTVSEPAPLQGVAAPGHAEAPRQRVTRSWLAAAVVVILVGSVLAATAFRRDEGALDVEALMPDHDLMFCSFRSGAAQYYRWSPRFRVIERFAVDTAASEHPTGSRVRCTYRWNGVPAGDSVVLLTAGGGEPRYEVFSGAFDRADKRGRPLLGRRGSAHNSENTLIYPAISGVQGAILLDWSTGDSLVFTDADVSMFGAGHSQDPEWALLRSTVPGNEGWYRVHRETGRVEVVSTNPLDQVHQMRGDSVLFARGAQGDDEDGGLEIFLRDLNTGEEVQLTDNDWNDYELDWSPTGRHLCWQSEEFGHYDAEIMVMDLQTRESWNLTQSPGRDHMCRFTPNGRGVIYQSLRTGDTEIFIQGVEGGPAQNVTNFPDHDQFTGFFRNGGGG